MNSLKLILNRKAYFAPSWVFASINIMVGTWVLYLPHIKAKFALSDAEIGTALFFSSLGLIVSLPIVPRINKKFSEGRSTQIGIVLLALAFNLPLLAPTYAVLCASLLIIGILSGFTDISMNSVVSLTEERDGQNFMSAAHGFFSLGGFIGGGIGSLVIAQHLDPAWHMAIITVGIVISNLILSKHYVPIKDRTYLTTASKASKSKVFQRILPVIGLSMAAFIVMMNEGAVEHWSTLYLFEVVQLNRNTATLGFVMFSLTMTLGRFLGDGMSQKIGSVKTLAYGFIVAVISYGLILSTVKILSIGGFALLGFGLSVIVPELVRLAGRNKQINASQAIASVTGIGYVGFLTGPIILGYLAHWTNLSASYIFLGSSALVGLCITVLIIKRRY
jgi:MFS family permease